MEWPGKKRKQIQRERGDKEKRGICGKDEDREVFEAQVFLIWSRLFTVGLPSGFHQGFMYNLT